jgi:hypothetical protein
MPRNVSDKIAGLQAENGTRGVPNTKQKCWPLITTLLRLSDVSHIASWASSKGQYRQPAPRGNCEGRSSETQYKIQARAIFIIVLKRYFRNTAYCLQNHDQNVFSCCIWTFGRSQWLRGLGHELSSPARTLGSSARIPLETWMSVCIYSLCVATGWSPIQGVLPTLHRLRNWKSGQGPKSCRAIYIHIHTYIHTYIEMDLLSGLLSWYKNLNYRHLGRKWLRILSEMY